MGKRLEDTDPAKVVRILEKLAMGLNRPSYGKIAADEGVSKDTVYRLAKRNEHILSVHSQQNSDTPPEVPETFEEFIPMLREKAYKALNVSDDDIKNASLAQRGVFAGISLDKAFILEGRPTALTGHIHEHRHLLPGFGEQLADALRGGMTGTLPEAIEGEIEEPD